MPDENLKLCCDLSMKISFDGSEMVLVLHVEQLFGSDHRLANQQVTTFRVALRKARCAKRRTQSATILASKISACYPLHAKLLHEARPTGPRGELR